MMRRLLQPFWVLLAVIFLIEAWLWDHLEPIVARIVALIRCAHSSNGCPNASMRCRRR